MRTFFNSSKKSLNIIGCETFETSDFFFSSFSVTLKSSTFVSLSKHLGFFRSKQSSGNCPCSRCARKPCAIRSLKIIEPLFFGNVRADAVGFQIFMLVPNFLRFRAAQKINQIRQTHSLFGAGNRAQGFLRDDRAVKFFKIRVAVVAIAAVFVEFSSKYFSKNRRRHIFKSPNSPIVLSFSEHYLRLPLIAVNFGKIF